MNAVDTNVLARLVLQDDELQLRLASDVVSRPIWVSHTVWLELGWVLGKRLRLDRETVADALEALLSIATLHTSDREGLRWAVRRYRAGADWGDMIHVVSAKNSADQFLSFDRGVASAAGCDSPLPIETLT